jgi:hypothetical protein
MLRRRLLPLLLLLLLVVVVVVVVVVLLLVLRPPSARLCRLVGPGTEAGRRRARGHQRHRRTAVCGGGWSNCGGRCVVGVVALGSDVRCGCLMSEIGGHCLFVRRSRLRLPCGLCLKLSHGPRKTPVSKSPLHSPQLEASEQRCAKLEKRLARQAATHDVACDALRAASQSWGEGLAGDLQGAAAAMTSAAARLAAAEEEGKELRRRLEDAEARAEALRARAEGAAGERDTARREADYLRRRVVSLQKDGRSGLGGEC